MGEDIGISEDEAKALLEKFFSTFPNIKKFMEESQGMARKYGFVETLWGRKRRIPDMQLPQYTFENLGNAPTNFNPLDFDDDQTFEISEDIKEYFTEKLNKARYYKEKESIKQEAFSRGIKIHDNSKKIADAERQCVNSRVQGSAGDQSKVAMINCFKNKELKELGFKLVIVVHDELIAECPKENAKRCGELMSSIMAEAAKEVCKVPFRCDVAVMDRWEA